MAEEIKDVDVIEGEAVVSLESREADPSSKLDQIASSVKEAAQKTTEAISKAIESALSARYHVVMVRVNEESLKKLDELVQAGIFRSRSESAAFLIAEGIKAQGALFERISQKIEQIERLRSELRSMISAQQ
jgi:Arc/MetJ-type ribon-helix-helix transcriptional regulator